MLGCLEGSDARKDRMSDAWMLGRIGRLDAWKDRMLGARKDPMLDAWKDRIGCLDAWMLGCLDAWQDAWQDSMLGCLEG
jgi:hypothetical protein